MKCQKCNSPAYLEGRCVNCGCKERVIVAASTRPGASQ